jgi:hypothetical protein
MGVRIRKGTQGVGRRLPIGLRGCIKANKKPESSVDGRVKEEVDEEPSDGQLFKTSGARSEKITHTCLSLPKS